MATNGLPLRADDHGNAAGSATRLSGSAAGGRVSLYAEGVVEHFHQQQGRRLGGFFGGNALGFAHRLGGIDRDPDVGGGGAGLGRVERAGAERVVT